MLTELSFAGMLFSPLVVCIPLALFLTASTRYAVHRLDMLHWLWSEAWFDIALFISFLALAVALAGRI